MNCRLRILSVAILIIFLSLKVEAQSFTPHLEVSYGWSRGDNMPFWHHSNTHGLMPIKSRGGYLLFGGAYEKRLNHKLQMELGGDLMYSHAEAKKFSFYQLYGQLESGIFELTVGSKVKYRSFLNPLLSSGDMVESMNARPIPSIDIAVSHFSPMPLIGDLVLFKGNFSVGRSFDNKDLSRRADNQASYVRDVMWHTKSLYLKFGGVEVSRPLSLVLGLQHAVQWGGTSTNERIGKQPQSMKDFLRVVLGKGGDEQATLSDQINVLGNHYGAFSMALAYDVKNYGVKIYRQHFFDDKSGIEWANFPDGLWGGELNLRNANYLKGIVFEYLNTRNQSGPLHFITFDHASHSGRGGGADNYYNNGEYTSGVSYYGRSIGSPILLNPNYNTKGIVSFRHNRMEAFHLGINGAFKNRWEWRILMTYANSWGTPFYPLAMQHSLMSLFELSRNHPSGRRFGLSLAIDHGNMIGDNYGLRLFMKLL